MIEPHHLPMSSPAEWNFKCMGTFKSTYRCSITTENVSQQCEEECSSQHIALIVLSSISTIFEQSYSIVLLLEVANVALEVDLRVMQ